MVRNGFGIVNAEILLSGGRKLNRNWLTGWPGWLSDENGGRSDVETWEYSADFRRKNKGDLWAFGNVWQVGMIS